MKHHSHSQLWIGLFILVLGVLALVDNLNLFEMRNLLQFWPTVFIVFGALKLKEAETGKQKWWPIGFIALGILMTLNNLGFIQFHLREWWPAILIAIGVKIIFFDRNKTDGADDTVHTGAKTAEEVLDITAIMGESKHCITTQQFRMGDITAIMGAVELDFRQANIVEPAVLDITSIMGGVVLQVPREWIVVNQTTAIMGGIEDKTMPTVDASKRLLITGTAIMGGIEIKN